MPSQLTLLPQDPTALRSLMAAAVEPMLLLDASLQVLEANEAAVLQLELQVGDELHGLLTATGTKLLDWLRLAVQAHAEGRRMPAAPSVQLRNGSCAHVSLASQEPQPGDPARWLLQGQPEVARPRKARKPAGKPMAPQHAEPALESSREQAERAYDEIDQWLALSPQPMVLFEAGGLLLRCNASFAALMPGSPSTLHETPAAIQNLLGWQRGRMLPALQGTQALQTQASLVDTSGRTRWLQAQVQRQAGTAQRYMAVLLDRTAEQERDLAHQQLDALMDTAGVGLATFQQDAGWLRPRTSAKDSSGGSSHPLAGLQGVGRDIVEPESLPEFEKLQQALKKGERLEVEYAVRHPELGQRWLLTRVEPGALASGQQTLSVVTLDVTARHQAQTRNEQLLRELTTIMDSSGLGMAYLRGERLVRCNPGFAQMLDLQPRAASAGTPVAELFAGLPTLGRELTAALPSLDPQEAFEAEFQPTGEPQRWLALSLRRVRPALGHEPSEPETIVVISDISRLKTQQTQLQALLQERELALERERAVLDSVQAGIVTVGSTGIEWMNRSARRMFGGDLVNFAGAPISVVATSDPKHPFRRSSWLEQLAEGEAENFECQLQARDGRVFWVFGNVVSTGQGTQGRQLTYALLDVERRRQAEAQTLQAQASLRRIIETAPLAIGLFDAGTLRIEQINQAAAALAGRPEAELLGCSPEELFGPERGGHIRADMLAARSSGEVTQRDYELSLHGEMRIWDARYTHLVDLSDGSPEQLLLVASDVTSQRAAEAARLEAAIAQRELLVREVHHRIKNNLQGVAGLLQQIAARRPEVAGVINEAVGQVQAIAQVYGLQVGSTGPLRLRRVVESITGSVQRTFGRVIHLAVTGPQAEQVHQWSLPEAESIPIALSLNELLTNAVKHGPADGLHCTVVCEADHVLIEIRNRGSLPPGFDLAQLRGGVSGLGLVRALLPRRSARLSLEQQGEEVVCQVELRPPGLSFLLPL